MPRILIADDHAIVRRRLVRLLREADPTGFVDEAATGPEALAKVLRAAHDLIVLDISMPGLGGLEVLKELKRRRPEVPVLVLSMHREEQYAVWALRAGASGYLAKDRAAEELRAAVRTVLTGGRYVSARLVEKLVGESDLNGDDPLEDTLPERE